MKIPARKTNTSLQPPMTPMIDVVFLLLVFFIWTSSFDRPERDLRSQIAEKPLGVQQGELKQKLNHQS